MTDITEHTVRIHGLNLNVIEAGNPEGAPLVFLHGMRDVAWSLWNVAQHFTDDYRVLLPELRGHGKSEPAHGYLFEHFIYDMYRQLDALNAKPAIIVGHSLGGQIATRFASVFPEYVRGLVALEGIGPPAFPTTDEPSEIVPMIRAMLVDRFADVPPSRGMDSVAEAVQRLLRNNPRLKPAHAEFVAPHMTRLDTDGRYRWAFDPLTRSAFATVHRDDGQIMWSQVHCPVLIASGRLSHEYWGPQFDFPGWTGRYAEGEMEARTAIFPNGEHVWFDHSGHMVHYDEPDKVVAVVQEFIGSRL